MIKNYERGETGQYEAVLSSAQISLNNLDYLDYLGCHGLPAYSHHDRFPPWWVFVRDDNGWNLPGDKIPPLMMIMIRHLTQFNSSRSFVMLLPDCIDTALNTHRQKTNSHLKF